MVCFQLSGIYCDTSQKAASLDIGKKIFCLSVEEKQEYVRVNIASLWVGCVSIWNRLAQSRNVTSLITKFRRKRSVESEN